MRPTFVSSELRLFDVLDGTVEKNIKAIAKVLGLPVFKCSISVLACLLKCNYKCRYITRKFEADILYSIVIAHSLFLIHLHMQEQIEKEALENNSEVDISATLPKRLLLSSSRKELSGPDDNAIKNKDFAELRDLLIRENPLDTEWIKKVNK